jgi:hypothetical protein
VGYRRMAERISDASAVIILASAGGSVPRIERPHDTLRERPLDRRRQEDRELHREGDFTSETFRTPIKGHFAFNLTNHYFSNSCAKATFRGHLHNWTTFLAPVND